MNDQIEAAATQPIVTVQQHILEGQKRFPGSSGEFSWLLSGITMATKLIQAQVRRAGGAPPDPSGRRLPRAPRRHRGLGDGAPRCAGSRRSRSAPRWRRLSLRAGAVPGQHLRPVPAAYRRSRPRRSAGRVARPDRPLPALAPRARGPGAGCRGGNRGARPTGSAGSARDAASPRRRLARPGGGGRLCAGKPRRGRRPRRRGRSC